MSKSIEIGYLCRRGHFQFIDDPEGDSCGTKKIGTIYVKPIRGASPDLFREAVTESLASIHRKIEAWRNQ
ncbi:hypothetical protein [Arthrobacter bambusae]|uniref:hypothetical protein n=1 Tax=Arthrobacter bambusae TaxID=1338426 RepID=UPI0027809021|nr:hypothetical protein [Arthrobacter bambusae]MDQ0241185.1 hypothetical protein [Arthrobacter bambusae]